MSRFLLNRRYFVIAIVVGLVAYFATGPFVARHLTRALIGWDAGVATFLYLEYILMRYADEAEIKRRIIQQDKGGDYVLVAAITASILSITALVLELSDAEGHRGTGLRIALCVGTIVLSWFFAQIVFALRYAHEYYLEKDGGRRGGLDFGACGEPDFRDFLHFSIVIAATSQTADIAFTSKEMRRIGTIHTLVAFGFNTAILATMVNVAAGIF
jgi:uncharacterized membrane protein